LLIEPVDKSKEIPAITTAITGAYELSLDNYGSYANECSWASVADGALAIAEIESASGTQSRGISVGSLEGPYTAQRMSQGLMATQRRRATNLASTSPQTASHYGFLETVFLADRLSYIMRMSVSSWTAWSGVSI